MANVNGNEIPTIDVSMVTIEYNSNTILLDTASKIAVNVQTETQDAIKLIVKGRLIAQKKEVVTVTGNTIVLTDNVFNPEVVKILQGGTITYSDVVGHTDEVIKYEPPEAGDVYAPAVFELCAYSAIYDASGTIQGYEKITYPNCTGTPVALSSEDGVFRAPEYTINSAPATGEAPYTIDFIDTLPVVS